MKESAKISNAEWKVMEVLWDQSPLAPKEIVNALQAENWSYTTIMTMLSRLVKKEAVQVISKNNTNLYSAAVEKENCIKQETQLLLDKVFQGSVKNLIANFIKNEKLTKNDIKEIRDLINQENLNNGRNEK